MEPGFTAYVLGYLAGVLSTLSPCVLPLLPILLGSAVAASRLGPVMLTAGIVLSFSSIGLLVATAGASLALSQDTFRDAAAVLLVIAGIALMVPAIQRCFSSLASSMSNAGNAVLERLTLTGAGGQFVIGLVLGMIWSPCVGPTLGAAIALAAQGKDLSRVAALMAIYGLGAGTPVLLVGSVSRVLMSRLRGRLMSAGSAGKYVLGGCIFLLGILALTGLDKTLETIAVEHSPTWLINLTTRI